MMVSKLIKYLNDRPGIMAAYLFGSSVTGRNTRFSDVDIAILFDEGKTPDFEERLNNAAELSQLLKRDVDLVCLNDSPCVLRMQVITKGRILVNRSAKKVDKFVLATYQEYFDLKMVRRPIEKKLSRVSILD